MKLCLTVVALVSLLSTLIAVPALAQEPTVITLPPVYITARPTVHCYERPLVQGSGSVRICGAVH